MYAPYVLTTPLFYWLLLFTFKQVCFRLLHQLTCVDVLDFSIFLESFEPLVLPPHRQQVDFYSFVGWPIWPGPNPLCLICLLDFTMFWTGILPEFFFLPFFIMLTTSLANICNAFGMTKFVFNFYFCFINSLIAFW